MSFIDYYNRNIPEYYKTMYIDAFTPEEILYAFRQMMIHDYDVLEESKRAETEIMRIMEKRLKTSLDQALDDILKDFK